MEKDIKPKTREQEFFWQQYDGVMRALDLPHDYKVYDKRIYCVNKLCGAREKCLFWQRFMDGCKTFGRSYFSDTYKGIKRDQKGHNRCSWDKHYPKPFYLNASFGFLPDHDGYKPCEHFAEVDNKD